MDVDLSDKKTAGKRRFPAVAMRFFVWFLFQSAFFEQGLG